MISEYVRLVALGAIGLGLMYFVKKALDYGTEEARKIREWRVGEAPAAEAEEDRLEKRAFGDPTRTATGVEAFYGEGIERLLTAPRVYPYTQGYWEAGVTDPVTGEVRWSNVYVNTKTEREAENTFGGMGFYRNLVVRRVVFKDLSQE